MARWEFEDPGIAAIGRKDQKKYSEYLESNLQHILSDEKIQPEEKTQESSEHKSKSKEEMKDVEILEFGLSEEEINELIEKLNHLKQTKTEVSFEVDEENEFLIKYLSEEPVETKTDMGDMSIRG